MGIVSGIFNFASSIVNSIMSYGTESRKQHYEQQRYEYAAVQEQAEIKLGLWGSEEELKTEQFLYKTLYPNSYFSEIEISPRTEKAIGDIGGKSLGFAIIRESGELQRELITAKYESQFGRNYGQTGINAFDVSDFFGGDTETKWYLNPIIIIIGIILIIFLVFKR